jgi:transposase InsO family protein
MLREWAYGQIYGSSDERTANLARCVERYNYRRPHGSLGRQVPASGLNNLVRNYI